MSRCRATDKELGVLSVFFRTYSNGWNCFYVGGLGYVCLKVRYMWTGPRRALECVWVTHGGVPCGTMALPILWLSHRWDGGEGLGLELCWRICSCFHSDPSSPLCLSSRPRPGQ